VVLPRPRQAPKAGDHQQQQQQWQVLDEVLPDRNHDLPDDIEQSGPELSQVHAIDPLETLSLSASWIPS
jgi:hypothetical protein